MNIRKISLLWIAVFALCLSGLARELSIQSPLFAIKAITGLNGSKKDSFHIDQHITLEIHQLDSLLKSYPKDSLMLWMNNIAFPSLRIWNVNLCSNQLTFILQRDTGMKSPWNIFYAFPYRKTIKNADVQVGTRGLCVTTKARIKIHIRENWMIILGILSILLAIALFIYLTLRKELLRDFMWFNDTVKVVDVYNQEPTNEVLRSEIPYSLARSQLAFWTLILTFSLIFIWLNTDELAYITGSVLILLGISGGTSLIAKIVDSNRKATPEKLIGADIFKSEFKSKGFLTDIISDEKGVTVHRFQLVLFNLGLGIYFCWFVIYYLQLPVFSDTMLLLIGVSNSTYAGLKLTEDRA